VGCTERRILRDQHCLILPAKQEVFLPTWLDDRSCRQIANPEKDVRIGCLQDFLAAFGRLFDKNPNIGMPRQAKP
jgi:hypothetical protein